jgi:hypothetical protein
MPSYTSVLPDGPFVTGQGTPAQDASDLTAAVTEIRTKTANVDNTSDAAKPVSTATTTALNLKADRAVGVGLTPLIVQHTGGTDPVRPATTRPVIWVVPDANRPATNGTTAGGAYAAVTDLDILWAY